MSHRLFAPKPCNRTYGEEADPSVILRLGTDLREEEKASKFARYYDLGACEPREETVKMLCPEMELAPEHAFMPSEYEARMHHTGYNAFENGFCVMENGVGYVSLLTVQPGVDDEKMGFFLDHFSPEPEDLFYKAWCPGKHVRIYEDMAIEDMGWGLQQVRITGFFTKEDFGITCDLTEKDPDCIDFQAMSLEVVPLGAPKDAKPIHMIEANYFRQNDQGREIRHRFWIGLSFADGKFVEALAGTREETSFYSRNTAYHSGAEFATLTRNILKFYEDEKG